MRYRSEILLILSPMSSKEDVLREFFAEGQLPRLAKLLRRRECVSKKLQQIFKAKFPSQRRREKREGSGRIPVLNGQGKSSGGVGRLALQAGQTDGRLFQVFPILPDDAVAAALGRAKELQACLRREVILLICFAEEPFALPVPVRR